ncbi:uncharacterized protein DNG_07824 [Cephalotrichum gorgonifer]|uniref:Protein kinase domain-containing protein n=1 Tax=Cephalotrichum gorgonifer TaxID=2041049 RepID=A0AAE8N4Q8_9PEZI|nr:uncharacterized protein DNG_07824 [Cephalotrichum gorgonifer]
MDHGRTDSLPHFEMDALTLYEFKQLPSGETLVTHGLSNQATPHVYDHSAVYSTPTEQWADVRTLGRGTFGTITLQERQAPGPGPSRVLREVKKIRRSRPGRKPSEVSAEIDNEIRANTFLTKERPSFFVQFFGWYKTDDYVYLCLEYMPMGRLWDYINEQPFPELDTVEISRQILGGIQYLHENGCIHLDIRTPNILVASTPPQLEGWRVKIADFGKCVFAGDDLYDEREDIRTAGLVTLELTQRRLTVPASWVLHRNRPFSSLSNHDKRRRLLETGLSSLGLQFAGLCQAGSDAGVFTASSALRHPWVQLGEWESAHCLESVAPDNPTSGQGYFAFFNMGTDMWKASPSADGAHSTAHREEKASRSSSSKPNISPGFGREHSFRATIPPKRDASSTQKRVSHITGGFTLGFTFTFTLALSLSPALSSPREAQEKKRCHQNGEAGEEAQGSVRVPSIN